jgi:hypothetical protein
VGDSPVLVETLAFKELINRAIHSVEGNQSGSGGSACESTHPGYCLSAPSSDRLMEIGNRNQEFGWIVDQADQPRGIPETFSHCDSNSSCVPMTRVAGLGAVRFR